MTRDIVQFVPLREFKTRTGTNFSLVSFPCENFVITIIMVYFCQAKETLAEIPGQFLSFMKSRGIKPNPPPLRHQRSSIMHSSPEGQGGSASTHT